MRKVRLLAVLVLVVIAMAASGLISTAASAEKDKFPLRPVTIVVTHGAGSTTDILTRLIAPYFQKYLGQPVVVENLEGGGGRTARAKVFKEKPDGYTLLMTGFPSTQLGELVYGGAYKTAEWTYIYNILGGGDYIVIYVAKDSEYKTLKDLIAASQQKPIKIAIPGIGSSAHLLAVLLREKAGLKSVVVPFTPALQVVAVLAKDVPASTDSASGVAGDDRIRILAVGSDHGRSFLLPDVPTTRELGFTGLDDPYTIGLVGPPGMPADVLKVLADAMQRATADPVAIAAFNKARMGLEPMGPDAFKKANLDLLKSIESVVPAMKKDMQK